MNYTQFDINKQIIQTNIKELIPVFLRKAKDNTYICPFCNAGTGANKTGFKLMKHKAQTHIKCFSCDTKADIYALVQEENNIDFMQAHTLLRNYLHLQDDSASKSASKESIQRLEQKKREVEQMQEQTQQNYIDLNLYRIECAKNLLQSNTPFSHEAQQYLLNRGIKKENLFDFGIDESEIKYTNRILIFTGDNCFTARDIKKDSKYPKYINYNTQSLFINMINSANDKNVYVTEGYFNAYVLKQERLNSIALNSTSNKDLFIRYARDNTDYRYILCLDNDKAGYDATQSIISYLQENKIEYREFTKFTYTTNSDNIQDINDMYVSNKDTLITSLKQCSESQQATATNTIFNCDDIDNIFNNMLSQKKYNYVSTGFDELDIFLNGGIDKGLTVLGADSGTGKSTLCLQIADNIASKEKHVLYFGLEMTRKDFVFKTISRIASDKTQFHKVEKDDSLDISSIECMRFYERTEEQQERIKNAFNVYKNDISEHLKIIEGTIETTAENIQDIIEQSLKELNPNTNIYDLQDKESIVKPIVFIDYLQFISCDAGDNEQSKTKKIIQKLKYVMNKYDLSIVLLSALNRGAYNRDTTLTSFKESGYIESTADTCLMLQYRNILDDNKNDNSNFKLEEEQSKRIREVDIKIVKNRYGQVGNLIHTLFLPKTNTFIIDTKESDMIHLTRGVQQIQQQAKQKEQSDKVTSIKKRKPKTK